MNASTGTHRTAEQLSDLLSIGAALFVVLGAKLVLIKVLGAQVPYWDQWDGEAAHLYKPYLEGTLTWEQLLASHNEHRILFTRLWSLALLEINGVWSPKLQMVANAVLHVSVLVLLLVWLTRGLSVARRWFLCAVTAAVYAIPFGWGNTLAGFQSQFYFVFGFSMASLWAFSTATPFSGRWLAGLLLSVAAFFSMASGALTLIAIITLLGLQIAFQIRSRSWKEIVSPVLLIGVSIAMLLSVTDVPGHDPLKADGIQSFLGAFLKVAGWPAFFPQFGAVLLNAPIAILFFRALIERRRPDDPVWAPIAVMLWLGTQWLSFSYGRAIAPIAPRYLDTYSIGIVINCAAALYLMRGPASRWAAAWLVVGLSFFAMAVMVDAAPNALRGAAKRHAHYKAQTENLSAFLASGDLSHLQNKSRLAVPYPDPMRLAAIAGDPTIRKILHPRLTGTRVAPLSLPGGISTIARNAQVAVMRSGPLMVFFGFALFGYGAIRCWVSRPPKKIAADPDRAPVEGSIGARRRAAPPHKAND